MRASHITHMCFRQNKRSIYTLISYTMTQQIMSFIRLFDGIHISNISTWLWLWLRLRLHGDHFEQGWAFAYDRQPMRNSMPHRWRSMSRRRPCSRRPIEPEAVLLQRMGERFRSPRNHNNGILRIKQYIYCCCMYVEQGACIRVCFFPLSKHRR